MDGRIDKYRNGKMVIYKIQNPSLFRIICGLRMGEKCTIQIPVCIHILYVHTLSATDILTCNITVFRTSGDTATVSHYNILPANVFPHTIPL